MANQANLPLFLRLIKKIGRKFYSRRTMLMLAHNLANGHRNIKVSSKFEVRQFTAEDLPACQPHFTFMVDAYQDFLRNGHIGFAGFSHSGGEMGATVWYATATFTDQFYGCTIKLNDGEVFQMAGESAEPFRKTPLTANVMFAAWDYLQTTGSKRVLTLIQDDNIQSLKFATSAGYREIGEAYVIHRILGIRVARITRYTGERFDAYKKKIASSGADPQD